MCERTYTKEELIIIKKVKSVNPRVCYYCNKAISEKEVATVDHKIPVSKGGLTVEENLVIACYPCNQEKDDMTIEEYVIYKQKREEMFSNNEATNVINNLLVLSDKISNRYMELNNELSDIEKQLNQLQQDIMFGEHNACEGYKLTMMLKGLLLKREELKILQMNFNRLDCFFSIHKKTIFDIKRKTQNDIGKNNKFFLKRYATSEIHKRNKNNVYEISEQVQVAR